MNLGSLPFQIRKRIGSGTSASVYEALNVDNNTRVALKVFNDSFFQNSNLVAHFESEASALQNIRHPHINQLYRFWKTESLCFMELELIEGITLTEWLQKYEGLLIEPKIWILVQICRGLAQLHEREYIHRDLKPDNIMVTHAGEVKITDFGLMKIPDLKQTISRTGALIGSLAYLSPEILQGEKASEKSDLFSFGIIAYELLAGSHPFRGETAQSTLKAISDHQIIPLQQLCPRLPVELCGLIMSCLAGKPSERNFAIWEIESQLMKLLKKSGLLGLSRDLVQLPTQSDPLKKALSIKHSSLKSLLDESDLQHQMPLSELNEFSILFPQDPSLDQYLQKIKMRKKSKARRRLPFLLILVSLALPSAFLFTTSDLQQTQSSPVDKKNSLLAAPTQAPNPLLPNAAPAPTPAPDSTQAPAPSAEPAATTVQKPNKKIPTNSNRGTLRISVDPDAKVYVDGRRYPYKDLQNMTLAEGNHQLLIEKEGFLPIEETVKVIAGKVIRIHAKSNDRGRDQ